MFHSFVGLADKHMVASLAGGSLNPSHHLGEKVAVDMRNNDVQYFTAAPAQPCRLVVGLIAQLFGQLYYALGGGLTDGTMGIEGPRYRSNQNIQFLSYINDRNAFFWPRGMVW